MTFEQLRELLLDPRRLRAVEIDVAVEPPVTEFRQVVVGQLDGAATEQQCAQRNGAAELGQGGTTGDGQSHHASIRAAMPFRPVGGARFRLPERLR